MEPDLQKLLSDGEEVVNMMLSRGWSIFSQKLTEKIQDLQMIGNVEGTTAEEKVMNMSARMMAASILFDCLREIKGMGENHAHAKAAEQMNDEQGFIERG